MGAEVGAVAVIAGDQVPAQMGDRHDSGIFFLTGRRHMGVLLRRNPGRPGTAVHERIPAVVACMIRLGPLLPAGGDGALDGRILFLDIIRQLRIHIVGACGLRIETEPLMEFFKYVLYDRLLVFHGEHPDTEILRLIFFTKFLARKPQKGQADLIPILLVVFFCQLHRLVVEQAGIGHLYGRLQAVFVGALLLDLENI